MIMVSYDSVNMNDGTLFDTPRETVNITRISEVPKDDNIHIFAICVTSDNEPLLAVRRSSFAFQKIMTQRNSPYSILRIPRFLLAYMYTNEIREIDRRLKNCNINDLPFGSKFEELILLGGRINKCESLQECLKREIGEESDSCLTVMGFGDKIVKVTTLDKISNKTFINYCTLCYVEETLQQVKRNKIYNVEVRKLKSLNDCVENDKYNYLSFIYNTLSQ